MRVQRPRPLCFTAMLTSKYFRYPSAAWWVWTGGGCPGGPCCSFNRCVSIWRDFSRRRPAAIIASGGYVSVPVLLVSWMRRIPSVIFSGDAALGWATRVMAPLTSVATIAFEEARNSDLAHAGRANRIPGSRIVCRAQCGQWTCPDLASHADEPLIVVMGGSQGAHVINTSATCETWCAIAPQGPCGACQRPA